MGVKWGIQCHFHLNCISPNGARGVGVYLKFMCHSHSAKVSIECFVRLAVSGLRKHSILEFHITFFYTAIPTIHLCLNEIWLLHTQGTLRISNRLFVILLSKYCMVKIHMTFAHGRYRYWSAYHFFKSFWWTNTDLLKDTWILQKGHVGIL